jgi:steroid 5-alpha reductase family enzyme
VKLALLGKFLVRPEVVKSYLIENSPYLFESLLRTLNGVRTLLNKQLKGKSQVTFTGLM